MFEGITFTPELPPIDQIFKSNAVIETLCLGHYIHVDACGYIVWMSNGMSLHNVSNANPFTNLQRAVLFIQELHQRLADTKEDPEEDFDDWLEKHQIEPELDQTPPKVLLPDDKELYRFNEPHCTGGDSVVTVTRRQAIDFTREAVKRISDEEGYREPADLSDEAMLGEFIAVHWAWKVGEEKVAVAAS